MSDFTNQSNVCKTLLSAFYFSYLTNIPVGMRFTMVAMNRLKCIFLFTINLVWITRILWAMTHGLGFRLFQLHFTLFSNFIILIVSISLSMSIYFVGFFCCFNFRYSYYRLLFTFELVARYWIDFVIVNLEHKNCEIGIPFAMTPCTESL